MAPPKIKPANTRESCSTSSSSSSCPSPSVVSGWLVWVVGLGLLISGVSGAGGAHHPSMAARANMIHMHVNHNGGGGGGGGHPIPHRTGFQSHVVSQGLYSNRIFSPNAYGRKNSPNNNLNLNQRPNSLPLALQAPFIMQTMTYPQGSMATGLHQKSQPLQLHHRARKSVQTQARRRRRRRSYDDDDDDGDSIFERGPLKYLNPASYFPDRRYALSYWLITMNLFFYMLQSTNKQITEIGIRDNMKVFQGEQHRMWSSIVLHSGVMHLLLNSYSLKNYGPAVEQTHGKVRFLLIYLLSGWFGNSVGLRFGGMYDRSLGASGSIFGILGALVVYLWRCETEIGQFSLERPMGISPNSLVWTIGINLFYGTTCVRTSATTTTAPASATIFNIPTNAFASRT